MEVIIVGAIIIGILLYTKTVDGKKFIQDNEVIFEYLKESDYDFLVAAKYGDKVDPVLLYNKRIKMGFITIVVFLFIFLTELNTINIVLSIFSEIKICTSKYKSFFFINC